MSCPNHDLRLEKSVSYEETLDPVLHCGSFLLTNKRRLLKERVRRCGLRGTLSSNNGPEEEFLTTEPVDGGPRRNFLNSWSTMDLPLLWEVVIRLVVSGSVSEGPTEDSSLFPRYHVKTLYFYLRIFPNIISLRYELVIFLKSCVSPDTFTEITL